MRPRSSCGAGELVGSLPLCTSPERNPPVVRSGTAPRLQPDSEPLDGSGELDDTTVTPLIEISQGCASAGRDKWPGSARLFG